MIENARIQISDCTLQQGEGSPDLSFRETIELCRMLDRLNVDYIELKNVQNKKIDNLLIKSVCQSVRNTKIAVPVLVPYENVDDVWEALKEAASPRLQVVAPVSSVQMEYLSHLKPDAIAEKVCAAVQKCRAYTDDVEFVAVDSTRSDMGFLQKIIRGAIFSGAKTVTLCDTAGTMLPEETTAFFSFLFENLPELKDVRVGYSCSDSLHLADACAIAAVRSGVGEIKAASFRTNSISLENILNILNVKQKYFGIKTGIGNEKTATLTAQISQLCRSGLGHFFRPDRSEKEDTLDKMTVNTHESKESVMKTILKMGYELTEDDREKVWQRFVASGGSKDVITLKELEAIIATEAMQVPPACTDVQYVINTGSSIGAMSHMKLKLHGKQLEGISTGDGAIDAAFNSIEKATGRHFELDDFQIQSVTEGREAMGETLVRLRSDGRLYSGKGISNDIVGAGIMAYINAMNKIIYEEEEA